MWKFRVIPFLAVIFTFPISVQASDISSLVKDLGDKDKTKDASNALAKIGKPAVPQLIAAMQGNNKYQKRYAARTIREMGQTGSDAIPALENLLKDKDTKTREYAVEALGNMIQQAEYVKPFLKRAAQNDDESVRTKAIAAIENLRTKEIQTGETPTNTAVANEYTDILHKDDTFSSSKNEHNQILFDFWNSTITIGQWQTKPITITIIISIIMIVVFVAIAIKKNSEGLVIFFSSYFDLFLSFLPFIVYAICLIVISSQTEEKNQEIPKWLIYAVISVAVSYNYLKAYYDNRHTKFLAFCVGTGRITLGYLLPLIIILNLLEILSNRGERESTGEFILRKTMVGLMLWGATVFLHSLIGSYRQNSTFYEKQSHRKDEYYKEHRYNDSTYSQYEPNFTDTKNPYEILNISQHATKEEIKDAYRKLAQQYHPDKTANLEPEIQKVAHKKMKEINEAYESLTKELKC